MRQIMSEYGKTFLNILVVGLLVTYLFVTVRDDAGNQGILHIIGAGIQEKGTDYGNYADFKVYGVEAAKDVPVLTSHISAPLQVGSYRISDYITAVDYNGNVLPIKLVCVWDAAGENLTGNYNTDTSEINFLSPGIYEVKAYAVDDGSRKTICRVKIPVNK